MANPEPISLEIDIDEFHAYVADLEAQWEEFKPMLEAMGFFDEENYKGP